MAYKLITSIACHWRAHRLMTTADSGTWRQWGAGVSGGPQCVALALIFAGMGLIGATHPAIAGGRLRILAVRSLQPQPCEAAGVTSACPPSPAGQSGRRQQTQPKLALGAGWRLLIGVLAPAKAPAGQTRAGADNRLGVVRHEPRRLHRDCASTNNRVAQHRPATQLDWCPGQMPASASLG